MRWVLALAVIASSGCDAVLRLQEVHAIDAAVDSTPDSTPDAAFPLNPLLHYAFDTVTGVPCAIDSTGNHDGSCLGGAPIGAAGPGTHGGAITLDGATYITVPHAMELDPTVGFTVAVWVNVASFNADGTSYSCIVSRPLVVPADGDSWQICVRPGDTLFAFGSASFPSTAIAAGSWKHLAMTWDGTTMNAYLAGVRQDGMATSQPAYDAGGIVVGADINSGAPVAQLTGSLDEIYVFDRALSSGKIAALAM
jgi:hypothetical protein